MALVAYEDIKDAGLAGSAFTGTEILIVVCFACTVGVFCLLARSPQLQKERQQAGENTWRFLELLFIVTIVVGAFTVRTLFRRWRSASTEVFTSEV